MTIHNTSLHSTLPHAVIPSAIKHVGIGTYRAIPLLPSAIELIYTHPTNNFKPAAKSLVIGAAIGALHSLSIDLSANVIALAVSRIPFNKPNLVNHQACALLMMTAYTTLTIQSVLNRVFRTGIPYQIKMDISGLAGFGGAYLCGVHYPETLPSVFTLTTLCLSIFSGMKASIVEGRTELTFKRKAFLFCGIATAVFFGETRAVVLGALGGLCGYAFSKKINQR